MTADQRRGRRRKEPHEAKPQRPNSIVEAAYSAAIFSDRGEKITEEEKPADEECKVG